MPQVKRPSGLARREIIKNAVALTTFGGVVGNSLSAAPEASTEAPPKTARGKKTPKNVSSAKKPTPIGLDEFLKICEYLTETSPLDPGIAGKLLLSLSQDPRYNTHLIPLAHEVDKVNPLGQKPSVSPTDFVLSRDTLAPIMKEILAAWYLGLRVVEGKGETLTYFHALVYQATANYRSAPGACGGATQFWSSPPQEA